MNGPLPPNWREVHDPRSGRTYWYHTRTKQTTWVRPCAAADALKFKEEFETAQKAMAAIKGESPAKPAESPAKSDKEAPTEAKSPALD